MGINSKVLRCAQNDDARMNDRIVIDSGICHGQAYMRGTRIPVHQLVSMLANAYPIEELLREYPSLQREDILGCLDYAATPAPRGLRRNPGST